MSVVKKLVRKKLGRFNSHSCLTEIELGYKFLVEIVGEVTCCEKSYLMWYNSNTIVLKSLERNVFMVEKL